MNEADLIGGLIAGLGLFFCAIAFLGSFHMMTRRRFWGGVFRGWQTKEQAPILWELNRIGNIVGGLVGLGVSLFGLWIMVH
ncbi:MAG: hypothetical protein K2Y20_00040 [Sphingomonas sp.]|nr:hypothetical protein [Sphingomonas sp.]